ncbi:unnamed protein product [Nesidiocoris tenuis]|uniref:Proline dehydrogenase n=1 Tax=Nesidiocoris tenuis TaxID=355587 RepID=A0A6H5GZV8_9HEMI|nr:unnamed protein product [Nesidiocoris tenuis]
MRARTFVSQVVGGGGNVIGQKLSADDLAKRLEQAGVKDTAKFLEKVVKDSEGVIHLFPWSGIIDENFQLSDAFRVPSIQEGRMVRLISQLSSREEEMFRNMIRRINTLVKTAQELDVRIMIDAEQTYFQPAISRITLEMMRKYNTEKERARAEALGYADPINPNYEATSEMYHKTLTECLRRIKDLKDKGKPNSIGIMVASHNEDTVRFAIEKMKEIGVSPEDKVICFGQLLGMCDYITFPLGQAGYSAYKYIPYGPVNEVLPYLSRRAQENKGILKKIQKEKRLLLSELGRRLRKGQIFYKPQGDYTPV